MTEKELITFFRWNLNDKFGFSPDFSIRDVDVVMDRKNGWYKVEYGLTYLKMILVAGRYIIEYPDEYDNIVTIKMLKDDVEKKIAEFTLNNK